MGEQRDPAALWRGHRSDQGGRAQNKTGATSIRVSGVSVDGASLEYKGRTLTPLHFKMSPKSRPAGEKNQSPRPSNSDSQGLARSHGTTA